MGEVFFSGTAGLIEGSYSAAPQSNDECNGGSVAVVFPPNPKLKSTMNNKVAYTLYRAMMASKFSTLRINYRGVGRSAGSVATDMKELQEHALQDATSAMDWLQLKNKGFTEFWVVGFSFGSWLAMQAAMRRPEVTGMIIVCPPVGLYDTGFLLPCPVRCAVIHASDDTIVKEKDVEQFALALNKNRDSIAEYFVIQNTNHFFNNALPELGHVVCSYIKRKTSDGSSRRTVPGFKERKRRKTPMPTGEKVASAA